ncbi:IS630 transposase-related protein [Psychrobacter pygoscelis]|uniref:IS630 transposase-related protein n=1 Tax=Psychrobacter pygoscelis TaxID=2488563 RepID=UPI0010399AE1|nr:IS630 transposase-related protein [Psychrobacter pygoscelis]
MTADLVASLSIVSWNKDIGIKLPNRSPRKIADEALKQDIIDYPDAYHYERAARLGYSKSGIACAMKRLGYTRNKMP